MNEKGYQKVREALEKEFAEMDCSVTSHHFESDDEGYSSRYVSIGANLGLDEHFSHVGPVSILTLLEHAGLMAATTGERRVVHSDTPQFKVLGVFSPLPFHSPDEASPPTVLLEDLNYNAQVQTP